jgi:RNA polymerase sigma-70 factor (ECF subfamily)
MSQSDADLTGLLQAWSQGSSDAMERLAPLIVEDLRRMARRHLRGERAGYSLQPTELINQVYLRLAERQHTDWQNRDHFFAIAARLMRWVLTDRAKASRMVKRDGIKLPLDQASEVAWDEGIDHSALYEALDRHREVDPRQAEIVELRFFFGLEHKEIAEKLKIGLSTSKRGWRTAKAWLYRELKPK